MRLHPLSDVVTLESSDATPPPPGDVAVWWTHAPPAGTAAEPHPTRLSDGERLRAARFLDAGSRAEFVVGRILVRTLFARWLNLDPVEVPIRLSPAGRPHLDPATGPWDFSLSHSRGLVALAVTREARIGMDVEHATGPVDPWRDLAAIVLDPAETTAIASLPGSGQRAAFLRTWVSKEAILKALGTGLLVDPRSIRLEFDPGSVRAPRVSRLPDGTNPGRWTLEAWDPQPGWIGAVARVPGAPREDASPGPPD